MAHIVIKKLGMLIVFIFISVNLFAQQQTEPAFVYKGTKSGNFVSLNYFLSTPERIPLPDCLSASGEFRFLINRDGFVDSINVSGNLPDTLIKAVKKRILMTNGHWKFNNSESHTSKWFVYPVYVEHRGVPKCKISIDRSYYWIIQLYDKTSGIIITPTSYLIRPNLYSLVY